MKAAVLLAVWLVAYVVIGGIVWVAAGALLLVTGLDDLVAIMGAVALTIGLGWLRASWAQRRASSLIMLKTPPSGIPPTPQ